MELMKSTTAIVTTDQIKSHFSLYGWKNLRDLEIYRFENHILMKKEYLYYTNCAFQSASVVLNQPSYHINQFETIPRETQMINDIIKFTLSEAIIERYRPEIIPFKIAISRRGKYQFQSEIKRLGKKIRRYPKNPWEHNYLYKMNELNQFMVYEIRYKYPIISYLEQKEFYPLAVSFFKEFTRQEGMEFNEYIDKMVGRCMALIGLPRDRVWSTNSDGTNGGME
jgi:hypothetical protein